MGLRPYVWIMVRIGAIVLLKVPDTAGLDKLGKEDRDMPRRFADLKHKVFARHSNPWSAWTRWMSTPLVLVPAWTRRWSHAAIIGAWMAANPVIFPRPADEHAWATRAVLGEELWITERPRDTAMVVNAAAMLAGITALIAARRHRAVP